MRFPVLSDEELNRPSYEPGIYWFKVKDVDDKPSKKGNPMITVELLVDFGKGLLSIKDYLLCTQESSWKISQFCKSIGKEGLYKSGNIEPLDILEQQGKCEVHYQVNPNDSKQYLRVKSYIASEVQQKEELNDEIPF